MATSWITLLVIGTLSLEAASNVVIFGSPCPVLNRLKPYPGDCGIYITCSSMGWIVMPCPRWLAFYELTQRCEYPFLVPGCSDANPARPCKPSQCFQGTCLEDPSKSLGFLCLCDQGYTGSLCSEDVNECTQNSRLCGDGICINTFGSYLCNCYYTKNTGRNCEISTSTDPCQSSPCYNRGICNPQANGNFYCDCAGTGYSGDRCTVRDNQCQPTLCFNGGKCFSQSNGGFYCDCTGTGYSGERCTVPLNQCQSAPCANGGRCIALMSGGYNCDCTGTGYNGERCTVNPCQTAPCFNGGKCTVLTSGGFNCDCTGTGYSGDICTVPYTPQCQSPACYNGGRRISQSNGGFYCDCAGTGYSGNRCTVPASGAACQGNPCKHGRCMATSEGLGCDCGGTGYEGVFCDTLINGSACNNNGPCVRGQCLVLTTGVFCDCQGTQYTGPTCNIPVPSSLACNDNYCYPGACTNGVCQNTGNSYTCNCEGTVNVGPRCDMTACNYNGYNPCKNNGTCIPQFSSTYRCNCLPGLTGDNCEIVIPVQNCPINQCPSKNKYNYPDFGNCANYYNCNGGTLRLTSCPFNQMFDVITMDCKNNTDPTAVFCTAFK